MATVYNGTGTHVANLAMSAFRGVVLSNNGGVTYSGNASTPDGFTQVDLASGDYAAIRYWGAGIGTMKAALTASPVTVGDTLYAAALGRVAPTGTITVGKSLTTSGGAANAANDLVIEFLPKNI